MLTLFLSAAAAVDARAGAVSVENVAIEERDGAVQVTYALTGGEPARVSLRGVREEHLPMRITVVEGDVGEGIAPGGERSLVWRAAEDYPEGLGEEDILLTLHAEPQQGAVLVFLPVRGLIGVQFTAALFAACLDTAAAEAPRVVVAEIDSPGGDPVAAEDAADQLQRFRLAHPEIRLIAYVTGEAIGSAALLAAAFDDIYLGPDAVIGGETSAEDASLLVGVDLSLPPRFPYRARRWAEVRGTPAAVRDALFTLRDPARYTAAEALEGRLVGGIAADHRALAARLHYSRYTDGSAAVTEIVERRAEALRRAAESYDSLAAMIDEGLDLLQTGRRDEIERVIPSIRELLEDVKFLQQDFPFVRGLFNQEFPGGVAAVEGACVEAERKTAEIVAELKPARSTPVRRSRRRS